MLSFAKTGVRKIVLIACATLLVLALFTGCSKEKTPTLALSWDQDLGTWNLNEPDVSMAVSVKNLGKKDQWISVMAFENDCFKCEGFGSWTADWETLGKIPADGQARDIPVKFKPLAACPAEEYHFFVETRNSAGQKTPAINFATMDENHAGSKMFRVAIAEPVQEPEVAAEMPMDEPEPEAGQE